ncbi:hypothetical protein ACFY4C_29005 [Actinomadura viridis]|uniref:hypothetical protein n=1 Tax=Actinomadura viridis TaxID=58110 RepID=UPI00367737F1
MNDAGWDVITTLSVVALVLFGAAAVIIATGQRQRRRAADQVTDPRLSAMGPWLQQRRPATDAEYWRTLEEALTTYRPGSTQEEARRQELLQEVRRRLASA